MVTTMKKHPTALILSLLAAASVPAVVSAQGSDAAQPPDQRRPYRGLFTGLSTPRTPQSLVLTASLYGGYDDNVVAVVEETDQDDWWLRHSGLYGGAHAGLDYEISRRARRVDFNGYAGAQVRYYRHDEQSAVVPDFRGGADFGFELSRSTRLQAGHQIQYSKSYSFFAVSPFAAPEADNGLIVTDPAVDLFELPALRNSTRVTLTQDLWRYTSFTAGYGLRIVDFFDDEELSAAEEANRLHDYTTQSGVARIQYDRPLGRYATLNLGYGIRVSEAKHGTGEPSIMHDVRAGVSYSRALSFSRRTSLSFATGSALAFSEDLDQPESELRKHFNVIGNVDLLHELGRTWTARAGYFRGFTFREGFDEPFFSEGATAGIGGLVSRRLSFSAVGVWSLSTLQRDGQTDEDSFTATAQATYGLNSFLALFANYSYYKYDIQEDVPLDPRFPRNLDRQSVRAGITTSIPLLR
jgi:hypothetical protein